MKHFFKIFFLLAAAFTFLLTIIYLIFYFNQESQSIEAARLRHGGQYINLSKGKVRYKIFNPSGNETIVILPGAATGYEIWEDCAGLIGKNGYRVLAFDFYGRGLSDRVKEPYSYELLSSQTLELIDSLCGENEKVHMASLSLGGNIAVDFAVNYHERLKSLIMINPSALNDRIKWYYKIPVFSDYVMRVYWMPRAMEKYLEELHNPAHSDRFEEKVDFQINIEGYKHAIHSTWRNILTEDRKEEIKELADLNFPICLLWSKNDIRTRLPQSEFYKENIPDLKFHILDECGHPATFEKPEEVSDIMVAFLKDQ